MSFSLIWERKEEKLTKIFFMLKNLTEKPVGNPNGLSSEQKSGLKLGGML